MKISNVKLVSSNKRERIIGGVYIEYTSAENVVMGDYVELYYEDKKHYFEVTDISINGENLDVKAIEIGYWIHRFEDFDLRKLIGLELSKIEDPEMIKKIYKMTCWC